MVVSGTSHELTSGQQRIKPGQSVDVLLFPINNKTEGQVMTQSIRIKEGTVDLEITTRHKDPKKKVGIISQMPNFSPNERSLGKGEHVIVRQLPKVSQLPDDKNPGWSCTTVTNNRKGFGEGVDVVIEGVHAISAEVDLSRDARCLVVKQVLLNDGMAGELVSALMALDGIVDENLRAKHLVFFSSDENLHSSMTRMMDTAVEKSHELEEPLSVGKNIGAVSGALGGFTAGVVVGTVMLPLEVAVAPVALTLLASSTFCGYIAGKHATKTTASSNAEAAFKAFAAGAVAGGVGAGSTVLLGQLMARQAVYAVLLDWFRKVLKKIVPLLRDVWHWRNCGPAFSYVVKEILCSKLKIPKKQVDLFVLMLTWLIRHGCGPSNGVKH